jgi:GNAT superfamily N-acetyltransferase
MLATRLSLQPVRAEDFESMLALRIEAMRPSLERLGRFDPARARERLLAGFAPKHMRHIVLDGSERIGFVTVKPELDAAGLEVLRLDHLYLRTAHQGQGVGAWVMAWVKAQAMNGKRIVDVTALRDSEANRFYQANGFMLKSEEPLDIHYRWRANGAAA